MGSVRVSAQPHHDSTHRPAAHSRLVSRCKDGLFANFEFESPCRTIGKRRLCAASARSSSSAAALAVVLRCPRAQRVLLLVHYCSSVVPGLSPTLPSTLMVVIGRSSTQGWVVSGRRSTMKEHTSTFPGSKHRLPTMYERSRATSPR